MLNSLASSMLHNLEYELLQFLLLFWGWQITIHLQLNSGRKSLYLSKYENIRQKGAHTAFFG